MTDEEGNSFDDGQRQQFVMETAAEFPRFPKQSEPIPVGFTTLMVRNIPPVYTQEMLMAEWDGSGRVDFLYLPRRGKGRSHVGYAFVNFVSEEDAALFKDRWQKVGLEHSTQRKILNVSFAGVQGFRPNLLQLAKRCQTLARQPIIIQYGRRLTLEEALEITAQRMTAISL